MRVTEAARYLGVSINTLKAMSDSGKIIQVCEDCTWGGDYIQADDLHDNLWKQAVTKAVTK